MKAAGNLTYQIKCHLGTDSWAELGSPLTITYKMHLQNGSQEVVPASTTTKIKAHVSPTKSKVVGLQAKPIKTQGRITYKQVM